MKNNYALARLDTPNRGVQREGSQSALDYPSGLAKPALRALHAAGYTRLDQLTTVTESDLSKLHGMGPKAIGLLRDALKARGNSFAED